MTRAIGPSTEARPAGPRVCEARQQYHESDPDWPPFRGALPCEAKIESDLLRYTLALDPETGAEVDKATAALLGADDRVFYFESDVTRRRFRDRLTAPGGSVGTA